MRDAKDMQDARDGDMRDVLDMHVLPGEQRKE